MKIIDCFWEKENIGKRVVEITVEADDVFEKELIAERTTGYDYVVVKVPMNKPEFNFGLSSLGFTIIETQMNISKRYKSFPFEDRLVKQIYPLADIDYVQSPQEFEEIFNRITPNMFITDRIYLDPYFSKEASSQRYKNWLRTEFLRGTSDVTKMIYGGKNVGFGMERTMPDGTKLGLLGGIFEEFQLNGLGLMTASVGFIHAHKTNQPFKVIKTAISSNNVPMMQFYNYLNFRIDSMTYVFVKHNME